MNIKQFFQNTIQKIKTKFNVKESAESEIKNNNKKNEYYDIILFLLSNFKPLTKENITKYFEIKYNEKIDETALKAALSKFAKETYQNEIYYSLTYAQSEKEKIESTPSNEDEIVHICFGELVEEIKTKFKNVLSIIKDSENRSPSGLFSQGTKKILDSYPCSPSPHRIIVARTFAKEIVELLKSNDPIIRDVLVSTAISIMVINGERGYKELFEYVYAIVLRSINYKNNLNTTDEYKTLSFDDCIKAVSNSEHYQEKIKLAYENDPFDFNKESKIKAYAERIFKVKIVYRTHKTDWEKYACNDVCFEDTIAFHTVNSLVEYLDCKNDALDMDSTVNIICDYIVSAVNKN